MIINIMKTDVSGKIAVVTGGAKGYGAGIGSALRTRGVYVWITGRNETILDEHQDAQPVYNN